VSRTIVRATLARLQAEGLVETQLKRTAKVAQPTLEEAKEIFALRQVLEREAVRLVSEGWRPEFGKELEDLVREEEAVKAAGNDRVSIRLAGQFHIKLASLAGNGLLQRYLAELVSRCSLILATFVRPHSSECAIAEHYKIIEALRCGETAAAIGMMDDHLGSVESRALLTEDSGATRSLSTLLSRYTGATGGRSIVSKPVMPRRSVPG